MILGKLKNEDAKKNNNSRGVFRTSTHIFDKVFLQKNGKGSITDF